ncbi:hypothetical protein B0H14DRAFT_2402089, partial [Mycena olivaceomarginata]
QLFSLQFPGWFLDQASYTWDTSSAGVYGQFIKPTAVNEAAFRLVDQLYNVSPNGTNLSIVYEQLLDNLLPKYVYNGLAKQQDQIRRWLIRDVPMTQWIKDTMARQQPRELLLAAAIATSMGTTPSPANGAMFDISSKSTANGETLNRIELNELLMNEYLCAKQDWEVERDQLITQASSKALNGLTRKLSHITDTRHAQLASKYVDAVVRGYSHTIRQYMGYLNIASPAEALQDAKDSFRDAAMSSLDVSMKVYPVQLTPLDRFAGLSTSFTLEDLTQDPEVIRMQINARSTPSPRNSWLSKWAAQALHGPPEQGPGGADSARYGPRDALDGVFEQRHCDGEYLPRRLREARHWGTGQEAAGREGCAGRPSRDDGDGAGGAEQPHGVVACALAIIGGAGVGRGERHQAAADHDPASIAPAGPQGAPDAMADPDFP